ncbi:MAG TPA: TcpQ domain-containing protein [Limnobacter sp.]|nr:TcpQ domain-containing protein [Limnobacter sp.]
MAVAQPGMPVYEWLSKASGQREESLSPAPVQSAKPARSWALNLEDVRLDRALSRWAKAAGYSFRWDADRYLLIAAPTVFEGEFADAVQQVLESPGILYSEYPLEACIYANNPPLLRITRLGDQKQECR